MPDDTQPSQGWKQECDDADELLRLLDLEPDHCRTDGGSINLPKVKALLSEKTRSPVDAFASAGKPIAAQPTQPT